MEDAGGKQKMNFVFISPSKRKPKRVPLILNVGKNVDSPDKRETFLSPWEDEHNANDLDKCRTIKESMEQSQESNEESEKDNYENKEPRTCHNAIAHFSL